MAIGVNMFQNIDLAELSTFTVFIRLLIAAVFGGIIGLERGIKGHQAGMRTYMLVCMGSTLVMCTNLYIADMYSLVDPTRMGAQVISGIGFLGVGTIIITRSQRVKGLTTAAGLWASACLGLAIGAGFYSGTVIGIIFIFIIASVMRNLEDRVLARAKVIEIYLELCEGRTLGEFLDYIKECGYAVAHMQLVPSKFTGAEGMAAHATINLPNRQHHEEVLTILRDFDCIRYIEEV